MNMKIWYIDQCKLDIITYDGPLVLEATEYLHHDFERLYIGSRLEAMFDPLEKSLMESIFL